MARAPKLLLTLGVALLALPAAVVAQQKTPGAASRYDWPRTRSSTSGKLTVYQPQVDEWDGYRLQAHAACSVLPPGDDQPIFGVLEIRASTSVDRQSRSVALDGVTIDRAAFPSAPDDALDYQTAFQEILPGVLSAMALDQLESQVAIQSAEKKGRARPVKNTPPRIVFSQSAAVLVHVDGNPAWRDVPGTSLRRVLNTRALLLEDRSGEHYLHVLDGWLQARALGGPWVIATSVPPQADKVAEELARAGTVDLMEGPPDEKDPARKPSLSAGVPRVVVAETPTEIIVTNGEPDWVPLAGTQLLYVKNTTGNVFEDLDDQMIYVLASGRWFRSASVDGPWEYVPGRSLPPDFASIPDESPKENAKASVPGTAQAEEAVIANEIPQTARADRSKASFTSRTDGDPELRPIDGTPLYYVDNSPTPIIQVPPTSWYAVNDGVWFTGQSPNGPWAVADAVPPVIYSIPPSSPLHYVTYVRIYDATPSDVTVGYTPGYMGTVVDDEGVVVYGTGYSYQPYIGQADWYGSPVTYGFGLDLAWTPWTGWGYGYGFGWGWGAARVGWGPGWCWSPAPWWGPRPFAPYSRWGAQGHAYGGHGAFPAPGREAWGPHGWAANSGNIYRRWGAAAVVPRASPAYSAWTGRGWSGQVAHAYNSRTGVIAAGQRGAVRAIYPPSGPRSASFGAASAWGARATPPRAGEYAGRQGAPADGARAAVGGVTHDAMGGATHYYGSHDGNVYRYQGGSGTFQQYGRDGRWGAIQSPERIQSLQTQHWARQAGAQRAWGARSVPSAGFRSNGFSGGGFGGGGFRGGTFRGGGGGGGHPGGGGFRR